MAAVSALVLTGSTSLGALIVVSTGTAGADTLPYTASCSGAFAESGDLGGFETTGTLSTNPASPGWRRSAQ